MLYYCIFKFNSTISGIVGKSVDNKKRSKTSGNCVCLKLQFSFDTKAPSVKDVTLKVNPGDVLKRR